MANYTISKIELPNGDICNIKNTTYSAGTGLTLTNTTFKNERGIEYIRGTWTAASNVWTGVSTDSELYDGKQIILYMPFAGTSSAATLNLTLSGGGATGAKNVYFESTTRFTTHKAAYSQLHLIYHKTHNINGTNHEGWWYVANRDTTTTNATQIQHNFAVKAGSTAIVKYNIIVANSDGLYKHLKAGTVFDITMPIFYTSADIAANSTASGNYSEINFTVTTTQSMTLTANLPVYIQGTLSGTKFTPISTTPLTQTVPTSDDGYAYIFLGMAYNSSAIRLKNYHPIYMYKNNKFQLWLENSGATAGSYGDSSNQTPSYGGTFKVPYVTVDSKGRVTSISEHTVKIPASDNTNTTYTFENGTNSFKVTPSGGTAQTVTVTPSIINNVTGSGTSGYLAKFNGAHTITNGPQLGSSTTTFLRNDGTWATALTSHQDISGKVNKSGDTMTGSLKRYYSSASTDPMIAITANNLDATALWIGHSTTAGNPSGNYYKLLYKGTGSSPNNYLQLIAGVNSSSEVIAIQIDENGNTTFNKTITGSITGNAGTATAFSANKEVKLTGDVTGSVSSTGGWSIATTIGAGKVTNDMLAGSIANGKLANSSIKIGNKTISLGGTATLADIGVNYPVTSVAGNTGAITADTLRTSLGLSNAMHFLGVTTTNISTGTANTTATVTIGDSNVTAAAGDVVLYGSQEYVWGNNKWNLLGDESSYKVKQTAKSDPTASTTTSTTFIDTISQDANGVITATKKTLPSYVATSAGVTAVTWDSTNNKLTRTINGTAADVVTIATIKTALALTKSDVGLGNVANSTYAGGTAVTLNNSSKASSTASFYAPTAGGTADTQALVGNGATSAPKWVDISPSITIGAGTSSAAPTVNVTVLGRSGTAKSITTASTSVYGVTKLNDGIASNSTALAATANSALIAAKKVASSNNTSKLYLVGATSQSTTGVDSYSYQYTYTNNGLLSALKVGLNLNGTEKAHLEWNDTDQSIDFIFN